MDSGSKSGQISLVPNQKVGQAEKAELGVVNLVEQRIVLKEERRDRYRLIGREYDGCFGWKNNWKQEDQGEISVVGEERLRDTSEGFL